MHTVRTLVVHYHYYIRTYICTIWLHGIIIFSRSAPQAVLLHVEGFNTGKTGFCRIMIIGI